jgi:hypothetical protein
MADAILPAISSMMKLSGPLKRYRLTMSFVSTSLKIFL